VGVVIMGVCLSIFGQGHWALGANARDNFFTQVF